MAVSTFVAISLAVSAGPAGQAIAGKVTYSTAGAPTGKVLKELSAKTGMSLSTSPATERDVLVISVQDAPVKELLAKIAWAVGGSWKQEGDSLRLARTSEDTAAERARERASTLDGYAKALAKRKADLAASGELTATKAEEFAKQAAIRVRSFSPEMRGNQNFWEFAQKMAGESPAGRAIGKLMSLLTPQDLADLPSGIRVVYSTNPTRMQRSLGGAATAILNAYQRDQVIWAEAMAKHQVKNPTVGNTTYIVLPELSDPETNNSGTGKIGKVLFAMTRSGNVGGGVQVELLLANTKGQIISRGNGNIAAYNFRTEKQPEAPKDDPKVIRGEDAEKIAFNVQSNRLPKIPEEIRARLLQPEIYEPLAMFAGQTLLNAGKARKTNLVATLSDLSFMFANYGAKETPFTYWIWNQRMTNEVEEKDGWLTMRPIAAASARALWVDRKVLGAYLRRQASGARMNVEEQASWAIQLPLEDEAPLYGLLARYVATGDAQTRYGRGDGRILRFYGSLTKAQRAAAKEGGLPLAGMTPDQMAIIQRLVFAPYSNLQIDYHRAQEAKIDINNFYNGLMREPTESLPNGIPPDGRFELTESKSEVAFTADWEAQGYVRPSEGMDASQIAWQQFAESRLDLFPHMKEPYQRVDLTRLRMGKRTTYNLAMKFTPMLSLMNQLEDREYTMTQAVSFNGLPAAFRQAVEKQIEDYRKTYANSRGGTTTPATHTTPPPF